MIKYHDKSQATEDINIMRNKNEIVVRSRKWKIALREQ